MRLKPKSRKGTAVASVLIVSALVLSVWFVIGKTTIGKGFAEDFIKSPWNSGQTTLQAPANGEQSAIPDPATSAQAQDQQAQLEAQIQEQEQAAAAEQQAQELGQAPIRFDCTVSAVRTGENRSLLKVSVSAPNEIPEVWVLVNTERGDLNGGILMSAGSGEQVIPLRNMTQSFRPTVTIYSLPVFTEEYEMCSFR